MTITGSLTILEKSELPPAQARAILEVMEAEIVSRDAFLATKGDLQELALATKSDLQEFARATKSDFMELSAKMDVNFAQVRAEIAVTKAETIRWVVAFLVAQLGATVGLLKLLK